MNKTIIALLLSTSFAATATEIEHSPWSFNVLAGLTSNSAGDVSNEFTYGAEVQYNKWLLGATYFNFEKTDKYFHDIYFTNAVDTTTADYTSIYGGYAVNDTITLKAGYTRESWEFNGKSYDPTTGDKTFEITTDGKVDFLMLGLGINYEQLNVNLHYNIARNGDYTGDITDYDHWTLLMGYKF